MEVPQLPTPEEFRFVTRRRTRWVDEDNQQVLNHTVYLTLIEDARHEYFERLGLLSETNQFPCVLMQANTRWLRPVRGGVELVIATRTTRLGRSSFVQHARIEDSEGNCVCECEALLVAWSNETRTKTELDPRVRARIAAFEEIPAGA